MSEWTAASVCGMRPFYRRRQVMRAFNWGSLITVALIAATLVAGLVDSSRLLASSGVARGARHDNDAETVNEAASLFRGRGTASSGQARSVAAWTAGFPSQAELLSRLMRSAPQTSSSVGSQRRLVDASPRGIPRVAIVRRGMQNGRDQERGANLSWTSQPASNFGEMSNDVEVKDLVEERNRKSHLYRERLSCGELSGINATTALEESVVVPDTDIKYLGSVIHSLPSLNRDTTALLHALNSMPATETKQMLMDLANLVLQYTNDNTTVSENADEDGKAMLTDVIRRCGCDVDVPNGKTILMNAIQRGWGWILRSSFGKVLWEATVSHDHASVGAAGPQHVVNSHGDTVLHFAVNSLSYETLSGVLRRCTPEEALTLIDTPNFVGQKPIEIPSGREFVVGWLERHHSEIDAYVRKKMRESGMTTPVKHLVR